jgi:hypothetical protein
MQWVPGSVIAGLLRSFMPPVGESHPEKASGYSVRVAVFLEARFAGVRCAERGPW